jgi:hypothetical protein
MAYLGASWRLTQSQLGVCTKRKEPKTSKRLKNDQTNKHADRTRESSAEETACVAHLRAWSLARTRIFEWNEFFLSFVLHGLLAGTLLAAGNTKAKHKHNAIK